MNYKSNSLYNLISIFRGKAAKVAQKLSTQTHCQERSMHDFYCDAQRPFISVQKSQQK